MAAEQAARANNRPRSGISTSTTAATAAQRQMARVELARVVRCRLRCCFCHRFCCRNACCCCIVVGAQQQKAVPIPVPVLSHAVQHRAAIQPAGEAAGRARRREAAAGHAAARTRLDGRCGCTDGVLGLAADAGLAVVGAAGLVLAALSLWLAAPLLALLLLCLLLLLHGVVLDLHEAKLRDVDCAAPGG